MSFSRIPIDTWQTVQWAGKDVQKVSVRCIYCKRHLEPVEKIQLLEDAQAEERCLYYLDIRTKGQKTRASLRGTCSKCRLFLDNA